MQSQDIILIKKSLARLIRWIESNNYKGYDPGDGLTSFLRPLTFNNLLLERVLQQLIWKFPLNLRPFLGVKPLDSCIGRGFFARGYLKLYQLTGNQSYKNKAFECLNWLIDHKSPYSKEFAWGKMFNFSARGGRQRQYEPITIWSSLIGQAFLDGYEIIQDRQYLDVAESVSNWIMSVPRTITESGVCINYSGSGKGDCTIHNQSMQAAFMLARTARYIDNKDYLVVAKEAVKYTCERQRSDGSWLYGEDTMFHWVDNFHTAYVLDGLKGYIYNTGDRTYEMALEKGYRYYINNFFTVEGAPKYYNNKLYPIDIQCASQAIDTLVNFSDYDKDSVNLAIKVAKWTILNMQDEDGHFYFRCYPFIKAKAPMIHWGQATMFRALSSLLFMFLSS